MVANCGKTTHTFRVATMFVREYGLVHNPSDTARFVRLVKWEGRWSPPDTEGYETYSVVPTVWEWTSLDVSNPRAYDYNGPVFKMVPTAITELMAGLPVHSVWPREAPGESEVMRRERIRALRRACHVDPAVGSAEPAWIAERTERPKLQDQWMAPRSGVLLSELASAAA